MATLNASFSGVSGLDQLGGSHGGVINGGPGSAITVMQSYAEQVEWLSGALAASYEALTGQNAFVTRGMDIADEGGVVGDGGVSFPPRPRPRFESFTFTPPMVMPALSINQLNNDFMGTRIGELIQASQMWHKMSADVAGIAGRLQSVVSDLSARNRGDVIEAAIGKISEVAQAGETFAANSTTMGNTVQTINVIQQQGAVTVAAAMPVINAIPNPLARAAAERSFLASFPASYNPAVAMGVPPIRNLMVMDPAPDGGGEVAMGMGSVEGQGRKHDATGLRAPGAPLEILGGLQRAVEAGSFNTVQEGVHQLAGVDGAGLVQAGDVGTLAAGHTPVSMPAGLGSMGMPATGGVPSAGTAIAPGSLGSPALSTPMPGMPVSLGQSQTTAAGAGRSASGLGSTMGGVPVGGMGPIGAGQMARGRGVGSGAAELAAPVATAAPVTGAGIGAGGTSRSTGGMGRGMMPMMGAPMGAQQQSKSAKVKTVTSAVEEDANVSALLGERQPVVPGVIGAWARG
ncbi:MAG: hypothetical protein Q4G50_01935 [Corynebacterium sp.]|uniref:hypothetical protein n=1 Tax=Corynebacterium sp. TaxID=1720 RepID=UPI0026DF1C54|nr:hypothetical protein [Corynebacterium sp.]MDO5668742.1 hypothetical protein [Corynebacterium sp.]